ncbi:MAG: hypothetical protein A2Y10_17890 [Planctomycetes bacterium GWF2_41_51]|nr:MAG: hypothetical protein A2Y10_17890 [Planctomycetes bacterium GWF2_41_51]HBG25876.1 hypothetical protein [Phycisphaerales bacterium]
MNRTIKIIAFCFAAVILFIVSAKILYGYYLEYQKEKVLLARAVFSDAPIEKKKNVIKATEQTLKIHFPESTELLFADPIKGDPNDFCGVFAEKLCMSIEDLRMFEDQIYARNGNQFSLKDPNQISNWYLKHSFPKRIWKSEKDSKLFEIIYGVPLCWIKTCYEKEKGIVYLYYAAF